MAEFVWGVLARLEVFMITLRNHRQSLMRRLLKEPLYQFDLFDLGCCYEYITVWRLELSQVRGFVNSPNKTTMHLQGGNRFAERFGWDRHV